MCWRALVNEREMRQFEFWLVNCARLLFIMLHFAVCALLAAACGLFYRLSTDLVQKWYYRDLFESLEFLRDIIRMFLIAYLPFIIYLLD